jgi:hypothetical protein
MRLDAGVKIEDQSFVEKFKTSVERVFYLGDIPQQGAVSHLVENNLKLKNQLLLFVTTSMENIDYLITDRVDILGINNVVVAGGPSRERFIFLEPHTRDVVSTQDIQDRIIGRINYLGSFLAEI